MLKRFFLYGMPLYITVIELAIKHLLANVAGRHEEVSLLLSGPSIAVADMTLILPALTPKSVRLAINLPAGVSPSSVVIVNRRDQLLVEIATILFFILLALWVIRFIWRTSRLRAHGRSSSAYSPTAWA